MPSFGWNWEGGKDNKDDPDKPEPPPSDNLYVRDLPMRTNEETVRETFSKVGQVVELRLLWAGTSPVCGALVRMASKEQAVSARTMLDGQALEGKTSVLS